MRAGSVLLALALAGCGAQASGESIDACVTRATQLAKAFPAGYRVTSAVFTYDVTDLPADRRNALMTVGVNGSGPAIMSMASGNTRGVEADFIARKDTSRPALLMSERWLYQLQRPVTGNTAAAFRQNCALLAPEGRVVEIRTNVEPS